MKKALSLILTTAFLATVVGCKEKPKQQVIIIKKPAVAKMEKTQQMAALQETQQVNWMGSRYTVEIKREADHSLPLATDGTQRYYDNAISVQVKRADGSDFFNHRFLKTDFHQYVTSTYYDHGALLGIAFVKADARRLIFAASVGSPDKASDEYVPLILRLDNFGNYSVIEDTRTDIGSMKIDDETEEEEK